LVLGDVAVSKIRKVQNQGQIFFCPGCKSAHAVNTSGPRWTYNGNPDAPTFSPSILVTYDGRDAGEDGAPPDVCHSFVRDGMIQFLDDCTHELANQTVEIPEWPHAPGTYGGIEE
jgi:hypothetical protein